MKKVSVLIPVYNVQSFIEEAVNSILENSYRNIEIIIINDASNDGTFEILDRIKTKESRVKVITNRTNIGISKSLNKGLAASLGDYILRMDGDDISHKDRIVRKVNYLENNPDISIVGCSTLSIDTSGNIIGMRRFTSNQNVIRKTKYLASPLSHIWLCKAEVYKKLNGYRDLDGVEDYDFLLRALRNNFKISNLEEYFGYFVRLGREGNSISLHGSHKIELFNYAVKLDKEYYSKGKDSFPAGIPTKRIDKVFNYGMKYRNNALVKKGQKKVINSIIYILLCLFNRNLRLDLARMLQYKILTK